MQNYSQREIRAELPGRKPLRDDAAEPTVDERCDARWHPVAAFKLMKFDIIHPELQALRIRFADWRRVIFILTTREMQDRSFDSPVSAGFPIPR